MTQPDLSTDQGRADYRAELRRIAWPARAAGFVMIMVGAGLLLAEREGWVPFNETLTSVAWTAIGLGWVLFIAVIFIRTRHHRRRMAELMGAGE